MWARLAAVAGVLAVGVACDDHVIGSPIDGFVGSEPVYSCDFVGVQEFFDAHCVACHIDGGTGGFDLTNRITQELSSGDYELVVPNEPAASALWQSVSGEGPALLMPLGFSQPLDANVIDHIECWISEGAPL